MDWGWLFSPTFSVFGLVIMNWWRRFYNKNAIYFTAYFLIVPALILYIVFRVYPIVYGGYISLQEWDGLRPMKFIGLKNFSEVLFNDRLFKVSLLHNTIYALGTVTGKNLLGLFLALLLNERLRGRTIFRTILFMPVVMSFVAVGILWSWILNPAFGLLNTLLQGLHLNFLIREWITDPRIALYSLIGIDIWKWTGFHMVIFLAALQSIPQTFYEAAMIDGASKRQFFWHVTIHLLVPVTTFNVLISLIGAFNVFDLVFVVTQGGPFHATEVVLTHMYIQAFKFYRVGYGTAIAYTLFVIIFILSLLQMRIMQGKKYEF